MLERDERFFDEEQVKLRRTMNELIESDGICAMKLSTEDAGMPYEDIRERHRLFGDLLPIQLKIGGPEARNDMRVGVKIGCRSLIAPMIESPYGLTNFINACQETLGEDRVEFIDLQINVETRLGAENIESILDQGPAESLAQITVGRHDLCRSLDRKPNHPEVLSHVEKIVEAARLHEIPVSIGGRITPGDAELLSNEIKPDRINTREIGFEVQGPEHSRRTTRKLLEFEINMLRHERQTYRVEDERISARIQKLKGRQGR